MSHPLNYKWIHIQASKHCMCDPYYFSHSAQQLIQLNPMDNVYVRISIYNLCNVMGLWRMGTPILIISQHQESAFA